MTSWKPELFSRPALVMIDMRNAFFETPALAQQRGQVTEHCSMLPNEARKHDLLIVKVRTIQQRDKSTWTQSKLKDDQGFLLEGTAQARNLTGLDLSRCVEIITHRDSAFGKQAWTGCCTSTGSVY